VAEFIVISGASYEIVEGGYRIKFQREGFIRLIVERRPQVVYKVRGVHLFQVGGFVAYCQEVSDAEIQGNVVDAIEFSNEAWFVSLTTQGN
jgi:hypothetical protein